MRKLYLPIFFPLALLCCTVLLQGCSKADEETLEGIWERVNVTDIDSDLIEEWHFFDNELEIYQYQIENPEDLTLMDFGSYSLKNNLTNQELFLTDMGDDRFNGDWDVLTLNNASMVISKDIPGEILYKEFTKVVHD